MAASQLHSIRRSSGSGAAPFFIGISTITQVVLCLNNDDTGQKADGKLKDTLERIKIKAEELE